MSEPTIRRATLEDAPALSGIGVQTFMETWAHLYSLADVEVFLPPAYGLARTEADLADPAKAAWLVEADGAVIGYAQAGPCDLPHADVTSSCLELKRIYFLKAWQNGGLGERLFAAVMAWMHKDGAPDLWIGVWSENHGAQRFYARHAFQQVGTYGFVVGEQVDHEFILRRTGHDRLTPPKAESREPVATGGGSPS